MSRYCPNKEKLPKVGFPLRIRSPLIMVSCDGAGEGMLVLGLEEEDGLGVGVGVGAGVVLLNTCVG